MVTLRDFLVRGLLAGLLAGLAAFAVGYVIGEPPVAASIGLEEAAADHSHDHGDQTSVTHSHGDEESEGTEVPRSLQSTLGLATGMLVLGAALGGLAGIVTGLSLGRFGRLSVRGTALAVAGVGFVSLQFVPFLIYPPNPPAVGNGDTIGYRTGLYFAMVAISVIAALMAILSGRALASRLGGWYAGLAGLGIFLVIVLAALGLMPRYDEVGADFPASLLYQFRLSSLLTQLTLWGVLGLALADLTHRVMGRHAKPAAERVEALVG